MKFFLFSILLQLSFPVFSQNKKEDINRQIEEIMKAREEMIKSLLNDSAFSDFDTRFEDLVKKFQNDSFAMPGMNEGAVVGEYDWKETEGHKILVLKIKQIKDRPLDIKIEKGQIKLKGDVESVSESESKGKKSKSISKVHFERSFSIPEGVDQTTPEFENKGGEMLIKFKKIKASSAPLKKKNKDLQEHLQPIGKDSDDQTI